MLFQNGLNNLFRHIKIFIIFTNHTFTRFIHFQTLFSYSLHFHQLNKNTSDNILLTFFSLLSYSHFSFYTVHYIQKRSKYRFFVYRILGNSFHFGLFLDYFTHPSSSSRILKNYSFFISSHHLSNSSLISPRCAVTCISLSKYIKQSISFAVLTFSSSEITVKKSNLPLRISSSL